MAVGPAGSEKSPRQAQRTGRYGTLSTQRTSPVLNQGVGAFMEGGILLKLCHSVIGMFQHGDAIARLLRPLGGSWVAISGGRSRATINYNPP